MHPTRRSPHAHPPALARVLRALVSWFVLLGAPAAFATGTAGGIEDDVEAKLKVAGRAVVFIDLRPEAPLTALESYADVIARAQQAILDVVEDDPDTRVRYRYRWIPSLVVEVDDLAVLRRAASVPGVSRIYLDVQGRGALCESRRFIRAGEAYALGVDGTGTVVAVLDSGIEDGHPALEAARLAQYEARFLDQGNDIGTDARDGHGHGTHVAGIIASRGLGDDCGPLVGFVPRGVAPGARVIAIKVLDDQNRGWLSDWQRGMDEVLRLHFDVPDVSIDVVNMSLELDEVFDRPCDERRGSFAAACRVAADEGIALFAAAGNQGEVRAISLPACYTAVLAVGSVGVRDIDRDGVDDEAVVSSFGNRGELLDLVAPGENILSTGLAADDFAATLSGTSQACPHAAAVACLMRHADPSVTSEEIYRIVVSSGRSAVDAESARSYPILDARSAIELALAPSVRDVTCDSSGEPLTVRWEIAGNVASLLLHIERDGIVLADGTLPGHVRDFHLTVDVPGHYTACITAVSLEEFASLPECCEYTLPGPPSFRRGDCDGNETIDIGDAVKVLFFVFATRQAPPCLAACDTNGSVELDDIEVDISDAIYLLNHLFRGWAPPPPPYPECGTDSSTPAHECLETPCGRDA